MNPKEKLDMYHFSDEISALSRDFYHQLQDEIPEGTELEFTLEEWIPLFVEFVQKRMNDGKAGRGLCDKHTYVTHHREQYQDADSIRDILAFLQEE